MTAKERVFRISENLTEKIIDSYNLQGFKLYYYKENFELIEILKFDKWEKEWGIVFFLNDNEFKLSTKMINKCKDIYDNHMNTADAVTKVPLSLIYHNILKVDEE